MRMWAGVCGNTDGGVRGGGGGGRGRCRSVCLYIKHNHDVALTLKQCLDNHNVI